MLTPDIPTRYDAVSKMLIESPMRQPRARSSPDRGVVVAVRQLRHSRPAISGNHRNQMWNLDEAHLSIEMCVSDVVCVGGCGSVDGILRNLGIMMEGL